MADQKEMRAVYVETLMSLAEEGKDIIVLEADLMRATGTTAFAKNIPSGPSMSASPRLISSA